MFNYSITTPLTFCRDRANSEQKTLQSIKRRITVGRPLNLFHRVQYGCMLEKMQSWSLFSTLFYYISQLSTTWRQSYLINIFDRYEYSVIYSPDHKDLIISKLFRCYSEKEQQDCISHIEKHQIPLARLRSSAGADPAIKKVCVEIAAEYSLYSQGTTNNLDKLWCDLSSSLKEFTEPSPTTSTKQSVPITPQQLQIEIKLMKLFQQATELVRASRQVLPLTQHKANCIGAICDKNGDEVAYYKASRFNSTAPAIMERLIWDLSVICGIEDWFTPTKIAPEALMSIGDRQTRGSLQPALKGSILSEWVDRQHRNPPTMNEIIRSKIIGLVLGFFDAHADNIFYTQEGKLVFFDNTRCLSHGNGLILYDHILIPAYRSGIFELKQAYKILNHKQREFASELVANFKRALPKIEQYFKRSVLAESLKRLPYGWWNKELVLGALNQRIERLETALQSPQHLNLRDIAFCVHPELKFITAMSLIGSSDPKEDDMLYDAWIKARNSDIPPQEFFHFLQLYHLSSIGGYGHSITNTICSSKRMSPMRVKELCDNPTLNFDAILKSIFDEIDLEAFTQPDEYRHEGEEIINQLMHQAVLDCKDFYG